MTLNPVEVVLEELNYRYGKGPILSVVWGVRKQPLGISTGVVVIQLKHGITMRRFTVRYTAAEFEVRFLSKIKAVTSDFFSGEFDE